MSARLDERILGDLVLSTELITWIGHRKELQNLRFEREPFRVIRSDEGLTRLETLALYHFTVANLRYKLIW